MIKALVYVAVAIVFVFMIVDFIRYVSRPNKTIWDDDEYKRYYWRCLKEAAKEVREERKKKHD